ncbi:cytochrome c biogenesis protein CcsA [Pseudobacteroides cellulosolvens]|uniref:Cytochrome c assembly protein n=1 Tax=Pseudobacteroides cellulosolvens ATCC 35603 = DSM 2933 TaxID=398512 RepID=A0A0L6JJS4_9FIRM|nr:cytochrome c biogenesis protein CcsA [Pseudobacteroides cellulosolvens]KNY26014.1 cytochrome c assembly protein [Pseudobacteroides cellulosolvens ATCC 35603 = DSM 2933]
MDILGNISLITSLVAGIFSIILIKCKNNAKFALKAGLLSSSFIIVSSFVLIYLLISGNFSIEYVFKNTDRDLPLIYKISALWSSSSGSLLLWATCISIVYIFIYGLFYFKKNQNHKYLMCLTATTTILNLAFLVVLIFINNPFKIVGANSDGFGLNPSLQSIGMVFHPPLVMISYSCLFAAFASNLYEILYSRSIGQAVQQHQNEQPAISELQFTRNVALLGWVILTAGIVSGGIWAYSELGWGGYWNWDPIENSALVTWLLATAYLHLFHLKKNNTINDRPLFILISATAFSILFGTFLARSGILNSVHAYSNHGSKIFFLVILVSLTIICLSVFIAVFRKREKNKLSKFDFNRFKLYIPPFLMVILAIIIMLMTIYPMFSSDGSSISEKTYDFLFGIVGLIIVLSSTIFFSLRHITNKLKLFIISISLISGAATVFLPAFASYPLFTRISLAVCAFCLVSIFLSFALSINNLFNNTNFLTTFIIHLSIVIIAFGFIGTRSMKVETSSVIDKNGTISIGNHKLKLISLSVDDGPKIKTWTARLSYYNGKITKDINTSLQFYKKKKVYHSEAFIMHSFKEDLYIIVENSSDDGSVLFKVSLFKWISLLWAGIILMVLASLLLFWKKLCGNAYFI